MVNWERPSEVWVLSWDLAREVGFHSIAWPMLPALVSLSDEVKFAAVEKIMLKVRVFLLYIYVYYFFYLVFLL